MIRWEYKSQTTYTGAEFYEQLRTFGMEGWEAWSMNWGPGQMCVTYFKRPAIQEGAAA